MKKALTLILILLFTVFGASSALALNQNKQISSISGDKTTATFEIRGGEKKAVLITKGYWDIDKTGDQEILEQPRKDSLNQYINAVYIDGRKKELPTKVYIERKATKIRIELDPPKKKFHWGGILLTYLSKKQKGMAQVKTVNRLIHKLYYTPGSSYLYKGKELTRKIERKIKRDGKEFTIKITNRSQRKLALKPGELTFIVQSSTGKKVKEENSKRVFVLPGKTRIIKKEINQMEFKEGKEYMASFIFKFKGWKGAKMKWPKGN